MNIMLEKKDKLGEGSYGIVYEADYIKRDKRIKVAVKRNFGDEENKGITCLREMSFLASFNHPCIIKLKSVSLGDPFKKTNPMTPVKSRYEMKEDSYHFILEYSHISLEDFYPTCDNYYHLKIIMCQTLLGTEYIHSKKIIHRDLKPGNILITKDEKNNMVYAKICDFGLSTTKNNYRPTTPGTVTSWYRAPEICCKYNYSYKIDIWSLGLIFFEIVIKKPLITISKNSGSAIFKKIINKIPEKLTTTQINKFIKNGKCSSFKHGYDENLTPGKCSIKEHLNNYVNLDKFNEKSEYHSDNFCELINNMIRLEPKNRFDATECINHNFFNFISSYYQEMRNKYKPGNFSSPDLNIIKCIERDWFCNIIIKLYNNYNKYSWYSHDILFHAIRLFDEYLVYSYNKNVLNDVITKDVGKIHSYCEVELYTYTCIYMMYKYFSTLNEIHEWSDIFPDHITEQNKEQNLVKMEEFENLLLRKIFKYKIYSYSLIDYLSDDFKKINKKLNTYDIRHLLYNYCHINDNYKGNTQDLYEQIKNHNCNNDTK